MAQVIRVLAIDPGKQGALCFCDVVADDEGAGPRIRNAEILPMPLRGDLYARDTVCPFGISKMIADRGGVDVALVEKQQDRPGMAHRFSLGLGYGLILSCLAHARPRQDIHIIAPEIWKPALGLSRDKSESVEMANQLIGAAGIERPIQRSRDGEAEAFLIAHYYVEKMLKEKGAGDD